VIGSGGGGGRVVQVSDDLVSDDLWERVAPLLPPRPLRRRRYPGRLPVDDRAALRGIVYVLRTGVTWTDVPTETIGCSGVTCWRRLRDWTKAGVWPRRHEILLAELRRAGLLDMEDAAVDASHVRALKGGSHTGLGNSGEGRWKRPGRTRPHHSRSPRSVPEPATNTRSFPSESASSILVTRACQSPRSATWGFCFISHSAGIGIRDGGRARPSVG
jgi:transposase